MWRSSPIRKQCGYLSFFNVSLWVFPSQLHVSLGPSKKCMAFIQHKRPVFGAAPVQCYLPLNSPILSSTHLLSKCHPDDVPAVLIPSPSIIFYLPPTEFFSFYVFFLVITYPLLLNICFRKKTNEHGGQIYKECSWRGGWINYSASSPFVTIYCLICIYMVPITVALAPRSRHNFQGLTTCLRCIHSIAILFYSWL